MIELRWMYGPRDDVERVLQYRYKEHSDTVLDIFGATPWSEWQSVPEVRAPTDTRMKA